MQASDRRNPAASAGPSLALQDALLDEVLPGSAAFAATVRQHELLQLSRRAIRHVRSHAGSGSLPMFARTLGLSQAEFTALRRELGADCMGSPWQASHGTFDPEFPYTALIAFIWSYRARSTALTFGVAAAMTSATFGAQHLWQDLGLAGRHEVTALLQGHFPELVPLNVNNLKWKRFLYLKVGQLLGQEGLQPPHCDGCDQYRSCYPSPGQRAEAA